MYGQIRLLYIIGLSILIQLILQLLKGLLFGFSISLESHSCWQYRRIKWCYLKVGLLNQIYNYDETPKDMMSLMQIYQKDKNRIIQYCLFCSIQDNEWSKNSAYNDIHLLNLKLIKNWNVAYSDYLQNDYLEWLLKKASPMFVQVIVITLYRRWVQLHFYLLFPT